MAKAAFSLQRFGDANLTEDDLLARLAWLRDVVRPRLERFLGYYRNPTTDLAAVLPCASTASFTVKPFRQYQELGLPARITGFRRAADGAAFATGAIDVQRKEVVVENDVGWRMNTLVDFATGIMPAINSTARDPEQRQQLTRAAHAILDAGNGLMMLQQLVLHGAVHGCAWIHLRPTDALLRRLATRAAAAMSEAPRLTTNGDGGTPHGGGGPEGTLDPDSASTGGPTMESDPSLDITRWLRLEIVQATHLCPLPHAGEPVNGICGPAYAAKVTDLEPRKTAGGGGFLDRMRGWIGRSLPTDIEPSDFSFELYGPAYWQRYADGRLVEEGPNLLGIVPFVRYENQTDLAAGTPVGPAGSGVIDTGASDVEPLMALQDELNTRLSDRAYRVTMTSFQMYLGRGIEDFSKRPVGPGQMWSTDNVQASIESFGGDASMPSEDAHINEIREAMDKISGVAPVAAGVIRNRVGNLTSAVALRLTLIALLARTDRKRAALGQALSTVVREVLGILDRAGILASNPEDRGIDINWPSALPENPMDRLQEAQAKMALGLPREVILSELGYGEQVAAMAAAADA